HQGAVCFGSGDAQAGDGARTRDPQLGKLMLYQLSYSRGIPLSPETTVTEATSTLQNLRSRRRQLSCSRGIPLSPETTVTEATSTLQICEVAARQSHRSDLNRRPLDYESSALPLSYGGGRMELRGLEPLTSAVRLQRSPRLSYSPKIHLLTMGATGLEPVTSTMST